MTVAEQLPISFGFYSAIFFVFFLTLVVACSFLYARPNPRVENVLFIAGSCFMVLFCALRPLGLGRDDMVYIGISSGRCAFSECLQLIQSSRDWLWHSLIGVIKSFANSERALLLLSAFGAAIQLFVISRLCLHKLLALTLFIPLTYIIFDISLLRAGLALSYYFIGLYLLSTSSRMLGSTFLAGNYLAHSQGIFSVGILPFSYLAKYKAISLALILGLLVCIYLQLTPSDDLISFLNRGPSTLYWMQYKNGHFDNERIFPLANLVILIYITYIVSKNFNSPMDWGIERLAFASILLSLTLAWFFAPIHAIQTRLFDFYVSPLIFLIGNLKLTRSTLILTLILATILYIRIEFMHNWIMG